MHLPVFFEDKNGKAGLGETDPETNCSEDPSVSCGHPIFAASASGTLSSRKREVIWSSGFPASNRVWANRLSASQLIYNG